MNRILPMLCMMTMVAQFANAQSAAAGGADLSRAQQSITAARQSISEKPTEYTGYNLLAAALVRRAQEIADASFYTQATEAVEKSLELAPNNFDAEKIRVSILLGEHEYAAALELAKALNKRTPDDVMVYGLLTDANIELGNYNDAEVAAQWMLDLRPGNLPALIRAAHLRELFGDAEGAYELMDMAYQTTPATEIAERASLLTQMGHLRLASGSCSAEKLLQQALTTFSNYPAALGNLAQLRVTQKRYSDAVTLLEQRYRAQPRADDLYDLAEALQLAGRKKEAGRVFADFETKALAESSIKDNSNRALIFYYADHAHQPAKALDVARREYAWRHDVYTLDAFAWALHVSGQDTEARKQIENALAVGIRDPKIFGHAGEIVLKLGDRAAAQKYLQDAVALQTVEPERVELVLGQILGSNPRH